jgi:hypothetical protein
MPIEQDYDRSTVTCLVGTLRDTSFYQLVEAFGWPSRGDLDKTRAEWRLRLSGVPVSIYDWKSDERLEDVRVWNVGGPPGRGWEVMPLIRTAIEHRSKSHD